MRQIGQNSISKRPNHDWKQYLIRKNGLKSQDQIKSIFFISCQHVKINPDVKILKLLNLAFFPKLSESKSKKTDSLACLVSKPMIWGG